MKIGSVSIWLGEASIATRCILALNGDLYIHGTIEELQTFSEEIQDEIAAQKSNKTTPRIAQ